ncbi:MAG: hypothetical protein ACTSO7_10775 [Candidatus Heimdallarchaeota archaeon]
MFFLILFTSQNFCYLVIAANNQGNLYANESSAPVIDGIIDGIEWNLGSPMSVILYDLDNQTTTLEIEIIALYSSDLKLYLAIIVPDDSASGDDNINIMFKTNELEPLITGGGIETFKFGNHHDIKSYFASGNLALDCYTSSLGFYWADDTPAGGTNDLVAAHGETGSHVVYEMAFPFDTGDSYGYDPQLAIGDTIEIFTLFVDDDSGIIYSQCRNVYADYDYNILVISSYTSPISIGMWIIFIELFSVTTMLFMFKKERKKG